MNWLKILKPFFFVGVALGTVFFIFYYFTTLSSARAVKANIVIDTKHVTGMIPKSWNAFSQGGEAPGTRMLQPVIPQISELSPQYIRIDHLYDGYSVVDRDSGGSLTFNWNLLDQTVCDIYATGARPFFSVGYMPSVLSNDGTPIGQPKNWSDWSLVVQKTIEHYSGKSSSLCGGAVSGAQLTNTYYEIWNEPDLETFGKWSVYGDKSYLTLYYYSALGAIQAQNVNPYKIGGPATTGPYQNWIQSFISFVSARNLPTDFISWHHYTKNPDDYINDVTSVNGWLTGPQYSKYKGLPKIISEWGYDSNYNSVADTNIGAAHTIMSIRNLIDQDVSLAFSFELRDGASPSWGILTNDGTRKPRFYALKFLNLLRYYRLSATGEGTYVRVIASGAPGAVSVILVNYDMANKNTELVPVLFKNLDNGTYQLILHYLQGESVNIPNTVVQNGELRRDILMQPNSVISLELLKQ